MSKQRLWTCSELREKRLERVRVTEEGANRTTCQVRCIKELQVIGNGLAHLPTFHLFPFPFPDLDVTHNGLMHEQENNWSLCDVVSEGDRVR